MSDDKELLSEMEEIENTGAFLVSKPSLLILLKNSLPVANFVRFLALFCSFPRVIPKFPHLSPFQIDPNNLDLRKHDLNVSDDLKLLDQLNEVVPDIKNVSLRTKRFHSSVNNILHTFANYSNLEIFDIQFDSVDEKNYLNVPFKNLKSVSIKINRSAIKNIRKTIYLVNNILRFTSKLSEATLFGVVISNQLSLSLSYNVKLKTVKFINCTLDKGPKRNLKMLLNVPLFEKILIQEFEDESNINLTEIFFDQLYHSKSLRNIKVITFNVFNSESIKYENIKLCTQLECITLAYFDYITPSFILIFKNLIGILYKMHTQNPFILNIEKIHSNNRDLNDSAYQAIYDDFENYIGDLDFFGPILYTDYI